eukprot:365494-Chlamydomonas_euryale.AAC.11
MQLRRGCLNSHLTCSCQCEGFGRPTRLALQHARLLETAARQRGRAELRVLLLTCELLSKRHNASLAC